MNNLIWRKNTSSVHTLYCLVHYAYFANQARLSRIIYLLSWIHKYYIHYAVYCVWQFFSEKVKTKWLLTTLTLTFFKIGKLVYVVKKTKKDVTTILFCISGTSFVKFRFIGSSVIGFRISQKKIYAVILLHSKL